MKKFIIKLLYFSLPPLIIAYTLDYAMSYYLSQSNTNPGEFEVWNDIYNSNANCDIAIYGSSRSWVHIDPKILSDSLNVKVYNFGIDGHNFWLQYLRHLEFLKHNDKPTTINLSVDIFSLQKTKNLYQLDQFLPYMLWNSNIQEYTSSYIGYDKFDYYVPLVRYSGKSKALKLIIKNITKGEANNRYRRNGFLGMDKEWNADLFKAKAKKKSYEAKTDPSSIALFESFIEKCKINNIELILVYTPEFIDGQNFVSNRDDVLNIYKNFATKYSLKFYDYSNDSICLNKAYFYNATHLNKKGAEIFSKDFANKLKARTHNNAYKK
jgi:hypothetical protein